MLVLGRVLGKLVELNLICCFFSLFLSRSLASKIHFEKFRSTIIANRGPFDSNFGGVDLPIDTTWKVDG